MQTVDSCDICGSSTIVVKRSNGVKYCKDCLKSMKSNNFDTNFITQLIDFVEDILFCFIKDDKR